MRVLSRMKRALEEAFPSTDRGRVSGRKCESVNILDPPIIRSKGAPRGFTNAKNAQQCRKCKGVGHDRHNCPAYDEDYRDSHDEELDSAVGRSSMPAKRKRARR
ncbi:hypothetical protein PIB30_092822 [Stylosanthes scabra]|uniref:CCHC-type domain-containing protein n=1 Tax=Stylosanthes scabra TaxID=79078 RepID=A0ABU6UTV4_9FABA|nr:hypothetical protein [Stylosanthes scabra]